MEYATLLISGADVRRLLSLTDCIDAVERVFGLHAQGEIPEPQVLGVHTAAGGFHVKAAAARLGRFYFAAKTNGNFPGNPSQSGLPSIQGVIVLCDADDGRPLAILDSMEITALRTAAATGVAARYLARPESAVITVVGCGIQGHVQLRAIAAVLPHLRQVHAFDTNAGALETFVAEMSRDLGVSVAPVEDFRPAALESDVVITYTTSTAPLLEPSDIRPGAFVAAVGADNPSKQELDPELLAGSKLVTDVTNQCAAIGELHHAVAAGVMTTSSVHAELGQIVAGLAPGRTDASEMIVFDSTGTALQDVAAAALVYERAVAEGHGRTVTLGN